MKRLKYIYIILLATVLIFSSCMGAPPKKIECGFTQEFVDEIDNQYQLNIPLEADFIGSYLDNAFRDPSIYIAFIVKESEFVSIISQNWKKSNSYSYITNNDIIDFDVAVAYEYTREQYTYLQCSYSKNGKITCLFVGRHPSESFYSF